MLENVLLWIVLATGVFNIAVALITKTYNLTSALLFKVLPFFLGCACILYFLIAKGILLSA